MPLVGLFESHSGLFTVVCHLSQTFSFFDSHSASVCSHFTSCLDHFVLLSGHIESFFYAVIGQTSFLPDDM